MDLWGVVIEALGRLGGLVERAEERVTAAWARRNPRARARWPR
jgi:hypothetical protein